LAYGYHDERGKSLKNISWKPLLTFGVILIALIFVLPTIKPGWWPYKRINLGLDLQGGMHLVLEVQTRKAVESTIERITHELKRLLKKENIRYSGMTTVDGIQIAVKIRNKDHIDRFEKLLDDDFQDLRLLSKSISGDTLDIMLDLPEKETEQIKKLAVEQALETIRNRIDQFGVSEPDIRLQGEKRILVQLPGIKDTERAKELIGKTALLEFKLVDETHDVNAALKGKAPPGSEILYQTKEDPDTRRVIKTPYLIKKRALLTGAAWTAYRSSTHKRAESILSNLWH